MADDLRVGLLYTDGELSQSIQEQCLGARLAGDYTRELWGAAGPGIALVERQVEEDPASVDAAARELVRQEGCAVLEGALSVPLSIRAAQWAEANGIVYATANNNPLVGGGRRHVFHIGVPSEITGHAVARFLVGERGAGNVAILHAGNEFQVHAANCTATSLREHGAAVLQIQLDAESGGDRAALEQLRDWGANAVMIYDSETERQVRLVWTAHAVTPFLPFVHARGMLCDEFRAGAGAAAAGHFFVDMFLRGTGAPAEEQALHRHLAAVDPARVATASHGFGWDELRLLAEAWRAAGPDPQPQIAFLERFQAWPGAGGPLTFTSSDHNGRAPHDPTTIAELVDGQFVVVSRLARQA
jgi:ABC-type branched-subunit amino acid transport system substrate-binding protein